MAEESVAQDQLRAFVERIERMNEEKDGINSDISEIYKEAVGQGFDRKALKEIVKIRAQDESVRTEHETIVDLYRSALGMASHVRAHEGDE